MTLIPVCAGVPSQTTLSADSIAPAFHDIERLTSAREIQPIVDRGRVLMVVRIGQDFSRRLAAGKSANIQVIVDGRQSNTALIALSYVTEIAARFSLERGGKVAVARRRTMVARAWFNPNLSSKWFMVPGLVASLTMIIATVITSLSIARESELGTLE